MRALAAVLAVLGVTGCGRSGDSGMEPAPEPPPAVSPRLLHAFRPGSIGFYYNPPTLVDGNLYIGTSRGIRYLKGSGNAFYKLNATTLAKVWEYPLDTLEVRGAAALDAGGNVYFFVDQGRTINNANPSTAWLYSLDPAGSLRWKQQVRRVLPETGMNSPAIGDDNTIYILGEKLFAFNSDGTVRWSYGHQPAAYIAMNAPIIDPAGNLYFSALGFIISVAPAGATRWIVNTSGEYFSSPAFSVDFSRIVVGVGNSVYCLRAEDGSQVWRFTPAGTSGLFRATPAVDDHDDVYIGTKGDSASVLYAIRADGTQMWQRAIGRDLYSSPAIGSDRTLYVGSEGARLWALDLATGADRWTSALLMDVTWSSPAVADDGTLYIASMDMNGEGGALYSFRTDSRGLLGGAGSPRFHESNASTGRRN